MSELQRSSTAAFITLTYDDQNVPWTDQGQSLHKKDFQDYMKRLRKAQAKITDEKIKYYACGEYGGFTQRPHYHAIMFNLANKFLLDGPQYDVWKNGQVRVDKCNIATIKYTVKYIMKSHKGRKGQLVNEFSLMSKGLGSGMLTPDFIKYYNNHLHNYIIQQDGSKWPFPRYFKEKTYDEDTRARLSAEALQDVKFMTLDSSKVFEINQMNLKTIKMHRDERNKI